MEEKKLRRSEKAREEAQEVDQAKNVLVINMHRFCINFWQPSSPFTPPFIPPFGPPSLPPYRKAMTSMHFTLPERQSALVHPMYAL